MFKNRNNSPQNTQKIIEEFKNATIDELWDSPDDLLQNFQNDSEYKKLLNGEAGTNVIYHYKAAVVSESMSDWTEHVIKTAYMIIKQNDMYSDEIQKEFDSVANYCRGLSYNVLGQDRLKTTPQYEFEYDIPSWLSPKNDKKFFSYTEEIKSLDISKVILNKIFENRHQFFFEH